MRSFKQVPNHRNLRFPQSQWSDSSIAICFVICFVAETAVHAAHPKDNTTRKVK